MLDSGFALLIGNRRNWAKWSDIEVKIFPAVALFVVPVEKILSIKVLNRRLILCS